MQGVWNIGQAIQNMAIGMANARPLVVNRYVTGVNAATGWTVPKIQYIPSPQWSSGGWCYENPTLHNVSVGAAEAALNAATMALEFAGAARVAQQAAELAGESSAEAAMASEARAFSTLGPQNPTPGSLLNLEEASMAAERTGMDMRMFQLRYEQLPGKFGYVSEIGGQILRCRTVKYT